MAGTYVEGQGKVLSGIYSSVRGLNGSVSVSGGSTPTPGDGGGGDPGGPEEPKRWVFVTPFLIIKA